MASMISHPRADGQTVNAHLAEPEGGSGPGVVQVPLMGHWATQDAAFAIATVDVLEEKFRAAKLDYTGHRYLAYHAFANETAAGPRRVPFTQYDPVWAQIAWDRTLRFFGRHLG